MSAAFPGRNQVIKPVLILPDSHRGRLDLPCKQTSKDHRGFESYIRLEYSCEGIPRRLLDETTSHLPAGTVMSERSAFSEKPELVHVT